MREMANKAFYFNNKVDLKWPEHYQWPIWTERHDVFFSLSKNGILKAGRGKNHARKQTADVEPIVNIIKLCIIIFSSFIYPITWRNRRPETITVKRGV